MTFQMHYVSLGSRVATVTMRSQQVIRSLQEFTFDNAVRNPGTEVAHPIFTRCCLKLFEVSRLEEVLSVSRVLLLVHVSPFQRNSTDTVLL